MTPDQQLHNDDHSGATANTTVSSVPLVPFTPPADPVATSNDDGTLTVIERPVQSGVANISELLKEAKIPIDKQGSRWDLFVAVTVAVVVV